jgi:hypothetical protein
VKFRIYRDLDSKHLRKVIVELYGPNGELVERSKMFLGFNFIARLHRRKKRMLERAKIFIAESC